MLFVSHNMAAVENLCSTAFVLDRGHVTFRGPAHEVVEAYLESTRDTGPVDIRERKDRQGDGRLRFVGLETDLRTGADSAIRFSYVASEPAANVDISVGLFASRGEGSGFLGNALVGTDLGVLPKTGEIVCRLPRCPLLPGTYTLNLYCTINGIVADWIVEAARVDVAEGDYFGTGRLPTPGYGHTAVDHTWAIE